MNWLKGMFEDNSGGASSSRVLMLLWGIIPLLVWSFACVMGIIHGIYIFPTIPENVVVMILGITGAKCVQRFGEKSESGEPPK